jgi:DUF4097 and DUF4098 domain-containing protein YvlB
MSKRFRISTMVTLAAFALVIATGVIAGDEWTEVTKPGERMFDEAFELGADGRLRLEVQDADVELVEVGQGAARVEVYVKSRSEEKGQEFFDDMNFRARISDNTLLVETRAPRNRNWSFWDSYRNVNMKIIVSVPAGLDVMARTDDGDIRASERNGRTLLKTSDGDIRLGSVQGDDVKIATSDGDVVVESMNGTDVEMVTSDGDVRVERLESKDATLATSDGDVIVKSAKVGSVSLSTSDGNIRIGVEGDRLNARTSDGDIHVIITDTMALKLRTHDGDVTIEAPSNLNASLDLRGERVRVHGQMNLDGEVARSRVVGTMGKGGVEIEARTSDGQIALDLR